ncbi:MAG: exopolysaccharide biosynthesis polyprenyl glycosylphosphotransferase [Solobacterium sp.]|nr:exopolysaccharide biosynthesis polyprenyl glycosylphosphotransferase [Solobacterium sp.]
MKKRRILSLLLFFSEMGFLFLLHRVSVPFKTVSFLRYSFMYFMLGVIFGRFQCNTNLIWDEIKRIILCNSSFFLATNVMNSLRMWTVPYVLWNLLISIVMSLIAIVLNRYYRIWFRKWLAQDVVIVGTGDDSWDLQLTYGSNRFALSRIVGVVDCNGSALLPGIQQNKRVAKNIETIRFDDLAGFLDTHNVDEIVIALPDATKEEMQVIYDIVNHRVNVVKSLPKVNGIITYQSQVEDFDGIVLISSSVGPMHHDRLGLAVKRMLDILIGLVGVIALIPLSVYVKIQFLKEGDKGPVFFKQERIGYKGRTFMLYKYRSMVQDAEKVLDELMENDPAIREEYETNKKLEHDPRVTAVGEKIRRSSIDEFPQFLNVLIGDMSFIGPRPYLPREKTDMGQYYETVTACKPGITGMWQTHGRSETSFEQRLVYDDYYYRNWSIWLDMTILVKTFKAVSSNTGAV